MKKSNRNEARDPALVARARQAFERTMESSVGGDAGPPDNTTLARVERAMAALPRTTREIFLAHRLDDHSYAKIADVTGLSIRQIERHLAKAIRQIDRFLHGDERTTWRRWCDARLPGWLR